MDIKIIQSMTSSRSQFFSLLGAVSDIETQHTEQLPDLDAQVLLMRIAMANDRSEPMNVTQAMGLKAIGSPAMLHRKINDLLHKGLVELVFEGTNRRTKYLVPTTLSLAIIDAMANAAARAYGR
jgi:DNA-binding MarR family transcriptional regulator